MESTHDQAESSQVPGGSRPAVQDPGDERSFERLKVFVSSAFEGNEASRSTTHRLIEALGHEAVLIGETSPALPRPPQRATLSAVADCDVMVLLLGAHYGTVQESGESATHDEWKHARDLGKDIVAFKEQVRPANEQQADFIREVRDYLDGRSYKSFSTQAELQEELVRALRRIEQERRDAAAYARRLPEPVSSMLESMRMLFPDSLTRAQRVLSAAAADGLGVITQLTDNPPNWATQPGPLVWEAIAEFIHAIGLHGASEARSKAIGARSPRSRLYRVMNAIEAIESVEFAADAQADPAVLDEAKARTEAIIAEIPAEDPLHAVAAARVRGSSQEFLEAVREAALQESEDPTECELGAMMLMSAYCDAERAEEALPLLAAASERHPDRPRLRLNQANLLLVLGQAQDLNSVNQPDLLERAHGLAIDARDRLREIGGPSYRGVHMACQALVDLGRPEHALRAGRATPHGEATRAEAAHPSVQRTIAEALLRLGRPEEIDQLDMTAFEPWLRTLTLAMQAHARDDPDAVRLMRSAFEQAPEGWERKHVAYGLALRGESVDPARLSLTDAEAAFLDGIAALCGGDPDGAVEILRDHALTSHRHADWLWRAQRKKGNAQQAIETLRTAVKQFGPDPLAADLVEGLLEGGRTAEAETAANDALSRSASRDVKRRLRRALVHIAEISQDWHKAYQHAAAMHSEDPEDPPAGWSAVLALRMMGRDEEARRYLRTHRLTPTTEEAAQLVMVLLGGPSASEVDAAGLLELAKLFPRSERVTGSVLVALTSSGERVSLTEEQAETARELLEEFVERFPSSQILRRVEAASAEEQAELLREMVRQRSSSIDWQLVDDVHAGRAPYGRLCSLSRSYAGLLLDSSYHGGYLTAVSADSETLEREVEFARAALKSAVVIDTSVAVLTSRTALGLDELAGVFSLVLVPDQLLADARFAAAEARPKGEAMVSYDSAHDRLVFREFSRQERDRMVEPAERVVAALERCQRVASGDVRPQWYPDQEAMPLVWDASVRVAEARRCALWCDDAALRRLAETLGIASFGTYALYEALEGHPARDGLPGSLDVKLDLLRAHIADVPIGWSEVAEESDDRDGPDPAWELWLGRPATWREPDVVAGFAHRVRELEQRWAHHISSLVHAACRGLGTAVVDRDRRGALGWVLARALLELNDPASCAAGLVDAARAAAAGRDRRSRIDPLPAAAELLLAAYEAETDAATAAQKLLSVFSSLPADDLRIAASVIGSIPERPPPAGGSESVRDGTHRRPRATARSQPSGRSRPRSRRPRPPASDAASDLGRTLRARRLSLDLTQEALAERSGVPRARVSSVESGMARHRIGTVLRLAREMRSSLSLAPTSADSPSQRACITSLNSLGRALRAAREELGWRQQDLADRAGVSRVQISKIESARSDALTDTVIKLADATGLVLRIDHDDDQAFELDDIIAAHSSPSIHSAAAS